MTQKLLPDHRQNRGISPKDARKQPAMTASGTPSCCSQYGQHESCIICRCSLPNSRDITRGMGNFIRHADEKSCMCEVHGGADRSSRRDLPRKCSDMHAWSCSRTVRARADAPAGMCRPSTPRTRTPRAQDGRQVHTCRAESALDGLLASIMQSSCLFRQNPADNAACAPRYTAAQPCRPAPRMPAHSQNLAQSGIFSKSKTGRS